MLMESVSKKSTLFENIGPPLIQLTVIFKVFKINLINILKKGRPYVFKKEWSSLRLIQSTSNVSCIYLT